MIYDVEIKPKALKDLNEIDKKIANKILDKIELLAYNLQGDVKKLTNFSPEYRLRVGDYRVLFEIEDNKVVVYKIKHRKNVYQG